MRPAGTGHREALVPGPIVAPFAGEHKAHELSQPVVARATDRFYNGMCKFP